MKKSIYRFSLSLISLVTFFSNAQINIYNSDGTIDSDRNVEHKDRYFNIHSYDISHFFITGSNGFVGINTTNPSERLEVIGTAKAQCLLGVNNTPSGTEDSSNDYFRKALVLGAGFPTLNNRWEVPVTRYGFNVYDFYKSLPDNHGNDEVFVNIVDRGGAEKFTFSAQKAEGESLGATIFSMKGAYQNEIFKISDEFPDKVFMHLPRPNSRIVIGNFGLYLPEHKFVVAEGSAMIEGNIFTNSNVGVGTSNFVDGTDTYRLSVNGAIRAHRVKVYTTWADYVFDKEYKLPTLYEVEKHIQENGHLKDIPSAKEVEENGIELGEMNKKLLQKVEELTLYIIEMNKELQAVKSQLKMN